ncbi:hypothetical protein [Streptomyces turgidiscabies]|uniref:Uncharacterized protein n=1 Tax=Streptomyces turgidiscabies TaxID=85558 RepID=A0ABU0RF27_9ACTN|nr:hypothetical protein [Streptomyces turgidiscabies]MDQ0930363.1 hypothetical protein [Streptomyces turgidiscabies]
MVDRLEAALVVDVLLVAAQPQGPGGLEAGRGAQRAQDVDRLEELPFRRRAVRDREAPAHRARGALEFADEQAGYVPVAAAHESARVDDLPRHVDLGRELERVVVTGERERAGERVHAHVDLVHRRVVAGGDLAARRAAGRQVRLVAALGGREDERVVDADRRLQGEFEARQLPHGEDRVDQLGVPVCGLLPLGRAVEGGHRALLLNGR